MCAAVTNEGKRRPLLLAVSMALAGLLVLGFLQMRPSESEQNLALVFPPQKSLTEIYGALSSLPVDFVRTGFADFIIVVRPSPEMDLQTLRDAGALLVTSAFVDGGCFYLSSRSGGKGNKDERIS
ncbi:hypothetical protein [Sneathiella limimaris]|uniref:hypothetical protein n=1 Tax=Sneathiella limimaris TaxID=1964213 RepID=UPI00146AF8C5|nr:hypothetical protein [Sneathiella limimaris]